MAVGNIDVVEIATQAVEAAAGIAGILNAFKIIELSRKYYDLYKHQREFYYITFQTGVEQPLAADTYFDPPYVLDYTGRLATAYNVTNGPFGGASTDGLGWWDRHGKVYGVLTPDPLLAREYASEIAKVKSDWTNYLLRMEENFYDVRNDIRWRKRLAVHNIGIKQGTAISAALDNSLANYQDNIKDFSNQLATYGNGIAKYVGYKKGLADTADNFNSAEYSRREQPARREQLGTGPE